MLMIRKFPVWLLESKRDLFRTFRHQINEESRLFALRLLKRKEHRLLIDFDNHFDSINNDWRNPLIKNELKTSAF